MFIFTQWEITEHNLVINHSYAKFDVFMISCCVQKYADYLILAVQLLYHHAHAHVRAHTCILGGNFGCF